MAVALHYRFLSIASYDLQSRLFEHTNRLPSQLITDVVEV